MRNRIVCLSATLLLLSAWTAAGPAAPAPPNPVTVTVGGQGVTLWPYTANDLATPSDPINLLFPDTDPRQLRQALMALDGTRPLFAGLPFASCLWRDAMGDEQAAWADAEGWVGGAVQMACVNPDFPLGDPFRIHVRFFREGTLTLGGSHLDFLIPGTAEHETLSWNLPQQFVTYDMSRTGLLTAAPVPVGLVAPGTFGVVRRPIYDGLVAGGAIPLLVFLGLYPAPGPGDVPVPANGAAISIASQIPFAPEQSTFRKEIDVTYDISIPKPFCAGPTDFVHLAGPLHLALATHTNPSGRYSRTYTVSGVLTVTPLPSGTPLKAVIFQGHSARMTSQASEVEQTVSETILSRPLQALFSNLSAGDRDRYRLTVVCGQ